MNNTCTQGRKELKQARSEVESTILASRASIHDSGNRSLAVAGHSDLLTAETGIHLSNIHGNRKATVTEKLAARASISCLSLVESPRRVAS